MCHLRKARSVAVGNPALDAAPASQQAVERQPGAVFGVREIACAHDATNDCERHEADVLTVPCGRVFGFELFGG